MGAENVILVGSRTEGKNVASLSFKSPYDYTLHPIVATVFNGNGESDYANGFLPTVQVDELQSIAPLYPLGDMRELMLNAALSSIVSDAKQEDTRAVGAHHLPSPLLTSFSLGTPVVEVKEEF